MGSKYNVKLSGTSNVGSVSVQPGAKAAGSVTATSSGETSPSVPTTQ